MQKEYQKYTADCLWQTVEYIPESNERSSFVKYRLLGKSGLRVSEAALGTMTFGDEWGWGSPKVEAQKVYETYREAGGVPQEADFRIHFRSQTLLPASNHLQHNIATTCKE